MVATRKKAAKKMVRRKNTRRIKKAEKADMVATRKVTAVMENKANLVGSFISTCQARRVVRRKSSLVRRKTCQVRRKSSLVRRKRAMATRKKAMATRKKAMARRKNQAPS